MEEAQVGGVGAKIDARFESLSGNRFRWALVVCMALLAIIAASVLFILPSSYSIPVFDLAVIPTGPWTKQTPIFTYYPNATLEIVEGDVGAGKHGKFLRCRIQPTDGWSGFGLLASDPPSSADASLQLRWRCTGNAPQIQIDVRERSVGSVNSSEVYSAVVPFVSQNWMVTTLPLKGLSRNQFYQPPGSRGNGILDSDRIELLAFTIPPGSHLSVEVADLRFEWQGRKWQILGLLLFVGFLFILLLESVQLVVQRRKAEHTLKTSEANYLAIFNAVKEAIWVLDVESGLTLDVNRTACDMLGLSRETMLGRPFKDLMADLTVADPEPGLDDIFSISYREFECRARTADGRELWLEVRMTRTIIGERDLLLVVSRDVSEKKEAEQERLKLEQRLMQSQKMEALGKLAGGVAHDFNNILTGIILASEMAAVTAGPNAAVVSEIQQIQELADRAAALTRQMLVFSRRQALRPISLGLNALVEHALVMLGRLIGEDVRLRFQAGTERDTIRADRGQIEQVLMNLVVNSRDAMPRGGELTIRTASTTVEAPSTETNLPTGEYVILEVEDTGCGMDNATRERIFEPFFTTKAVGQGTGLGLATVYGIVSEHGGGITVDSTPGIGATFRLYFPYLARAAEGADERQTVPSSAPGGSELILVVEDDPNVRSLVEHALHHYGYRTASASSAEQAETIYRQLRREVALLLTDIVMPGESGPQLYHRLTQEDPNLKVLFMSGYADKSSMCADVLGPGFPFIQKPFRPADLANLIRRILDAKTSYELHECTRSL